ncbi:hypothetical protein AYO39_02690 [Actinobacteria bacterium SCGC AG-212-D09]|nr:hypothetical protein AYO39_02690 [Actinobacteria bacterium SCGC AG-212-D09]
MTLSSLRRRREPEAATGPDPDLISQRDRLVERFAVMQSELGGLFYEMAIRDHVRMNILIQKAAELQRVEAELAAIEREIGAVAGGRSG